MMNVLNSAHKTLQAYPVIKGGLLGGAAVAIFWYLSDEKRRDKFKQFITNNSLLINIISPANVALFATVRHLINKKETVKRWLLFGIILNAIIIIINILKNLIKLFRNTFKQNTIYQAAPINSSYIKNPLILLIGISKYDETECKQYNMSPKLEGAKVDIDNLTELFTGRYKYKHVYRIDRDYMNKDKDLRDSMVTDSIIQSFCQYYANREKLIELNKPYSNDIDALILYYSGHGCENDWIFCGNGKLLSFYEIKNYFNESKCKYKPLKGKPKLFYLDCCREQIFSKFTTLQNSDIKYRGAQDTFNSKEEGNHDATNIYTFYATPNLRSTKERTKKGDKRQGGYMTNCFIKHFEDAQDKKTLNTMNKLAQKMKLCLKAENRQVGEERNCLVHDNITFIPSV